MGGRHLEELFLGEEEGEALVGDVFECRGVTLALLPGSGFKDRGLGFRGWRMGFRGEGPEVRVGVQVLGVKG